MANPGATCPRKVH